MQQSGLQKAIAALDNFNYESEVQKIIAANRSRLVDLLKEQLAAGKDMDAKPLLLNGRNNYRPFTIQQKKRYGFGLGAVTDRITLFMSGNLYNKLFATVDSSKFSLKSSAYYFEDVLMRTGDRVTGLSEESRLQFFNEILLPAFQKVFEMKTGIKLISK